MTAVASIPDGYVTQFRATRARDGQAPAWLTFLRQAAIERFQEVGFPSTREEEWKYTNVAPLARVPFEPVEAGEAPALERARPLVESLGAWDGCRLVFVNGHYVPPLSTLEALPAGVRVESLAHALSTAPEVIEAWLVEQGDSFHNGFVALNTAFAADGAFVYVPAGVDVPRAVHLVFVSLSAERLVVSYPRVLVVAERGSRVRFVETYLGPDDDVYFTNAVTDVVLADGASVAYTKVQREGKSASHIGTLRVHPGRDSRFHVCTLSVGGFLVRNEIQARLDHTGTECDFHGLYVVNDRQHVDNHLVIDHAVPHCTSRQFYKGVLGGKSRGAFSGRVVVRPQAQKTEAQQTNRNLLLSDEAVIDARPQLQIYADDVKCTHGEAIGHLDDDALFYLKSRGIAEDEAQSILTFAFANEILARVPFPSVRADLEERIFVRLAPEEEVEVEP